MQIGELKFVRQPKFDQGDISLRFATDRLVSSVLYDDVLYKRDQNGRRHNYWLRNWFSLLAT
jgi:hypothetical protein